MNRQMMLSNLLDALRDLIKEDERLENEGIKITSLAEAQRTVWECIKNISGMPKEEELGVFISDFWYDVAMEYVDGELDKETVVWKLLSWKNEFN